MAEEKKEKRKLPEIPSTRVIKKERGPKSPEIGSLTEKYKIGSSRIRTSMNTESEWEVLKREGL